MVVPIVSDFDAVLRFKRSTYLLPLNGRRVYKCADKGVERYALDFARSPQATASIQYHQGFVLLLLVLKVRQDENDYASLKLYG